MEDSITDLVQAAAAAPIDVFSPMEVFRRADIVVQGVILILVLMSVFSWAVMFDRLINLSFFRNRANRFEKLFRSSQSLAKTAQSVRKQKITHPISRLFLAGMDEQAKKPSSAQLSRHLALCTGREIHPLERGLSSLASIAATAPFIGLFGTVWGIMNAFQAIAITRETSLAAVAPGIAEALFATALGLFAAVPAVIFYNALSAMAQAYAARLRRFADELWSLTAREDS